MSKYDRDRGAKVFLLCFAIAMIVLVVLNKGCEVTV